MTDGERKAMLAGQGIVLAELWNVLAEIEARCNPNTGHGRAKLIALGEVVKLMDLRVPEGE